jgi:hypothetical protein
MPRGPKGEKRPADVVANAVHIMRIATGEIEETASRPAQAEGGKKGGRARADALSTERRKTIAKNAAKKRWKKVDPVD